ncbi:MAG: SDR family oxidoreductase [Clostridia bacterium]|nr:SDR family oxidoreductase [Clostridia bacterium]
MEFCGKVALITGAAQGIGRATAIELASEGASLVLIDVNLEGLEALKNELKTEYGTDAMVFECDISDEERVYASVAAAKEHFGKIDILVNNAALFRAYASFIDTPTDMWRKYFDVNVMGTVYVTKAALPIMIENGYGRIINVASVAGVYGIPNMAQYSATKAAIITFTKALAREVIGTGVLVNSVSPGSVSPGQNPDIDYTCETNLSYMGRTGSDRENANLICFLASDKSSYISGENIMIDGCRKFL